MRSRHVSFLKVWWSQGSQTFYMAASFPQSDCPKVMNRSCKSSYDRALEIPECHFCLLLLGNHVAKASQTQRKATYTRLLSGKSSTKFKIIFNLLQRQSYTKEIITYVTIAMKEKYSLLYKSHDFLMANDRSPTQTGQ